MAQENPNAAALADGDNPNAAALADENPNAAALAEPERPRNPLRRVVNAAQTIQPSPTTFHPETGRSPQEIGLRAEAQAVVTGAQMMGEALTGQDEGGIKAAWLEAAGATGLARVAKTVQFMFPKLGGRIPTAQEFDQAALKDPNLAQVWGQLRKAQDESLAPGKQAETASGRAVDWNRVEEDFAAAIQEDATKRRNLGDKTAQPGNFSYLTDLIERMAVPGVTRRPLSDEEIAGMMSRLIHGAESGEMGTFPAWTKAIAQGLAGGVQLAVTGPIGELAGASAAARGTVQFGWLSAANQTLAVASGRQAEFSVPQLLAETAIGGGSSAVGAALAQGYLGKELQKIAGMDPALLKGGEVEAAKRGAELLGGAGTLGSMELSNQVIDAMRSHQGEHGPDTGFFESALNRFLNIASTLGAAGALGGPLPGRPDIAPERVVAGLDAATKPFEPPIELARALEARAEGVTPSKTSELAEKRAAEETAKSAFRANAIEGLAQAVSMGDRFPAAAAFIRRAFNVEGPALKGAQNKALADMLPLRIEADRAALNLNRFLDQKTGNDPELRRQLMHALWFEVEGQGPRGREVSSMYRGTFAPETINGGARLLNDWARSLMEIGQRGVEVNWWPEAVFRDEQGNKLSVMKRDFDEGRYSREDALAGKYGALVGGGAKFAGEGGYLPHLSELVKDMSNRPWRWGRGNRSAMPVSIEGFLPTEFLRQRLMGREKTTPEFVTALGNAGRTVDTSYESIVDTQQQEIESITRKATLEDLRSVGHLRRGSALPADVEAETMRAQVVALEGEIGQRVEEARAIRKQAKNQQDVPRLRTIGKELIGLRAERTQLNEALSQGGWQKLEGKEWGEYDSNRDRDPNGEPGPGWYLLKSDFQNVAPRPQTNSSIMELASTLHRMAKAMKTGFSAGTRAIQDLIGNAWVYRDADLFSAEESIKAIRDNWRFRMQRGPVSDNLHEEFLALSKGHFLGGAGEMQQLDARNLKRASVLLDEAIQSGDLGRAGVLGLNKFAAAVEMFFNRAPVVGTSMRAYKAVVDEAQALAAYRYARTRGASIMEAWDAVQPIADYSTLPQGIQRAARGLSFVRYPAQMGRAYATRIAPGKFKFYGANLGRALGLDKIIENDPTSKKAQVALATRSTLNMISKAAEWAIPIMLTRQALLAQSGISNEQWDKFIDHEYRELGQPIRELAKMFALPTGKSGLGRINYLALDRIVPWMAPLSFWKAHPEGGQFMQLVSKNVAVSPWAQALFNRDFRMSTPEQGALPGERWWGVVSEFLPGLATATMQEVVREKELPPKERSYLRAAARMLGAPLRTGEPENELRKIIETYRSAGLVQRVEGEDGHEMYAVVNAKHPLSPFLDKLIQLYYTVPLSAFQANQRAVNKVQRLQEATNLR